jgi:diguanylate cyclase (GGDEF)-like protein
MNAESPAPQQLIFIVDDDPMTRILMRASLEQAGFLVTEAENGLDALDVFAKIQPDAILLDVMMPKLDGFATCQELRKNPAGMHTPILMITGLDDLDSIHKAFDSGATDFITKPINWAVLTYRVKYMLRASKAFHDVKDKQEQIQQLAFFDHLTGLANRTMFTESLETALAATDEEENNLAVLFLDLDRFKMVNDTLGHHIGDLLLQKVAERINVSIRRSDTCGRLKENGSKACVSRLGGDEFTIMLPRLKDPEDASKVARRIVATFTEPFLIAGHEIFISASIGISIAPLDGQDSEELMKHADLAMYHAKEQGKNNFQFYKKDLNIRARERFTFEADVRKAVIAEEFKLWYQPQVDMQNGRIIGAEGLTRWEHPTLGMVPPSDFIPLIEELSLVIPFTDWVIRQAGLQQLEWRGQLLMPIRLAINISSRHFVKQELPERIMHALTSEFLQSNALEVELTESVLATTGGETLEILQQLKKMGLSISIDDFGTGYSSLLYLKNFPIDTLKIDRFFIKDILTSEQDAAIVRAIIAMAKSLGMTVVGEGIETCEQYHMLREMGCHVGQGYLFSPAVPAAEFSRMLRENVSLAPNC